ncbi:5-carboxymethyl-2-hydroxymuconate isomerase [Aliiroseovarius subalbicans]|uniref:5-carboxymethyl-2-hydroxymuconate Delta-isomerase n=1 Tax=Aliiroseovarius subalbicans TaxID=2925840 RepID=UPI001F5888C3|nr:5-carboxymethyl-2-hydroxymuconate isomerase [uncultured Aliiroseovarius sp.]MCI2399524.1 5-carboxymethyl-2-hydroxymuconate isomerase [Aliiroseovarius subalbicans]
MPHLTIEHSAGAPLGKDLCDALFDALAAHPAIPQPESLKIRTLPCNHHRIGTEPQSFAHARLLLLPGRDAATKAALAQLVLECMAEHLPEVGSLSVDVGELSPAYVKRLLS